MKRMISLLLCIALCLTCVSVCVSAAGTETHSHPICDDYCTCGSRHTAVNWVPLPESTTLAPGYYYLDRNVTFSDYRSISITGDVFICLNGKKLTQTLSSHCFTVNGTGSLTICDCVGSGIITNTKTGNSGQACIGLYGSGSMTVYGGTVNGAAFGAIVCSTTGDLQIRGGTIAGASEGIGISKVDELTVSSGTITSTLSSGISCEYGTFRNITVSGGRIEGTACGMKFGSCTCTGGILISGGTLYGKGPVPNATTWASDYYGLSFSSSADSSCNLTISGGNLYGARGGLYTNHPLLHTTISGGTLGRSQNMGIMATDGRIQIDGGKIYGLTCEGPANITMTDGELFYAGLTSSYSKAAAPTFRLYGGTVGRVGSSTSSFAINNPLSNPKAAVTVQLYRGTVVGTEYAVRSISDISLLVSGGTLSGGTADIYYLGNTSASPSGAFLSLAGYAGTPLTLRLQNNASVGTYAAKNVPADGLISLVSDTLSALYDMKNCAVKINGPHTHSYGAWVREVKATCSTTGILAHKDCTICYEHFDASGNELTNLTTPIDGTNHVHTTEHPQQNATCTDTGYTAGIYCTDCNSWVSGHDVIPITHSYGSPRFVWTDLTSVSVSAACHCGHEEGGNCTLSWDSGVPGRLTLTAAATLGTQSFTDSRVITASADGDAITVTLPGEFHSGWVYAAAYLGNGQMTTCDVQPAAGASVTLSVTGETIRLFFLTNAFSPISPVLLVP